MITKKELEHLAELARLELTEGSEEKLLKDLEKILNHFEELKELDTEKVAPMTGGTMSVNAWREDEEENRLPKEKALEQFPKKKKGYLKVPPVFSAEDGSASGGEV